MERTIFPDISLTDNIKGVLIDIDNTLYSYETAHLKALQECYNSFSKGDFSDYSFEVFANKYREKRNTVTERLRPQGCCRSRLFAFQSLFEELKVPQAYNAALEYENIYWDTLIDSMELDQEAFEFLQQCKDNNIPVCAVSDMQAHFQIRKLQKLKVDHLIGHLVTSEEVGIEKPDATIFNAALDKLNLNTKDVIMIGDSNKKDIEGAEALGIKAFIVGHHK